MNVFKHFFLPGYSNNQRARLLHNQIIFLVVLLLVGSSFLVTTTRKHFESVLGVSVNIASQDLLQLTNQRRADAGLAPLQLNNQLAAAAENKAQDMFAKDYWAHFGPNGETPWDFIRAAGYQYVYAGENLARGFSSSSDVVNAWMASPDHRANMLSSHYTDVGFAVEQGRLPGDSSTVLVVEMFGSTYANQPSRSVPPVVTVAPQKVVAAPNVPTPTIAPVLSAVKKQPMINSAFVTKATSLGLLSLFLIIFGIDVVITENRKTVRLAGHSFDHLLFLIGILIIAISIGLGVVG